MVPETILIIVVVVFAVGVVMATLVGWAFFSVTRGTLRALFGVREKRPELVRDVVGRCGRKGCGTANPGQARFCRRCGNPLGEEQWLRLKKVPTW